MPDVLCQSLVGLKTGEALVQMEWMDEGGRHAIQMTSEEAVDLAVSLLGSAEAARSDLFLVTWMQDVCGAERQQAAGVLGELRAWRLARLQQTERGVREEGDAALPEGGDGDG